MSQNVDRFRKAAGAERCVILLSQKHSRLPGHLAPDHSGTLNSSHSGQVSDLWASVYLVGLPLALFTKYLNESEHYPIDLFLFLLFWFYPHPMGGGGKESGSYHLNIQNFCFSVHL